jgi:hypothetical protein
MILINAANGRTMTVGDHEHKKIEVLMAAGWREVKAPEMLQAKPVTPTIPATSFTLSDLQPQVVVETPVQPVISPVAEPVPQINVAPDETAVHMHQEFTPEVVEAEDAPLPENESAVLTADDLPEPATQSKQAKGRNKKASKTSVSHEWIGNLAET